MQVGITFGFDNWHHYWETGDISQCKEAYPALKRMTDLLISLRDDDGLLPVENIGVPSVWMDHDAYQQQRHKQCAFNLFASAMLANALAPMSDELGEPVQARTYRELANSLLAATIDKFWCQSKRAFVNNLPWIGESSGPRYCDRSLATAILFDQCPKRDTAESLRILAETPPELGLSYPANAFWRLRALAKSGRIDVVIDSFRSHWATMGSVSQNNTVQETWHARTDSMDEWSHSAVAPLNLLYMDIAGIQAASPGFREIVIRPQLGDITHLDVTAHTVRGPIAFEFVSSSCSYQLSLSLPEGCSGELLLPDDVECGLPVRPRNDILGLRRYALTAATKHEITCIRTKGKER